ncbi:sugar transferase [Enterococcus faecium]|uniref:sugar transferase n=1 Tax=Enterococcus faecium TaxID=1352 RepID=UPI001F16DA53|nr:sugar transferase [Enterococcus faecium]MDV7731923.1 sugar transferase [Enterococcus faecium]
MSFNSTKDLKGEKVQLAVEYIKKKKMYLVVKRVLDVVFSLVLLTVLLIPMIVIALLIFLQDFHSPFFLQERVTKDKQLFKIIKFRSMYVNSKGSSVTSSNDTRITPIGSFIRKYRIDEFPQLINVLLGDMTFVGVRPEVLEYVEKYTDEMLVTLLLPAGITSLASVKFKDESEILNNSLLPADEAYIQEVLPKKMQYNIEYVFKFGFHEDLRIILLTVKEVFF